MQRKNFLITVFFVSFVCLVSLFVFKQGGLFSIKASIFGMNQEQSVATLNQDVPTENTNFVTKNYVDNRVKAENGNVVSSNLAWCENNCNVDFGVPIGCLMADGTLYKETMADVNGFNTTWSRDSITGIWSMGAVECDGKLLVSKFNQNSDAYLISESSQNSTLTQNANSTQNYAVRFCPWDTSTPVTSDFCYSPKLTHFVDYAEDYLADTFCYDDKGNQIDSIAVGKSAEQIKELFDMYNKNPEFFLSKDRFVSKYLNREDARGTFLARELNNDYSAWYNAGFDWTQSFYNGFNHRADSLGVSYVNLEKNKCDEDPGCLLFYCARKFKTL